MLFSSTIFIFAFLPAVLLIYYLLPKQNLAWRNILLFAASLFFYGWGQLEFMWLILLSVGMNYVFGLWIDAAKEKRIKILALIVMLIANLGILFWFKYRAFAVININNLFNAGISIPAVVLPLGISFFTFQAISYCIDVYRGNTEVQKNPLYLGFFITFFPQLVAGPIVRYKDFNDQITVRDHNWQRFNEGVCRFIIGLGKKVLIANNVAIMADKAFNSLPAGQELAVGFAWLGAVAYALQIYFDFSGYSDMAIGLAKMFGIELNINFNFPYISRSVSEFWRRWHISLGTWFRDYVYFPLGGSRVKKPRLVFNLLVVWGLTGFWHGADWAFIAWGLLYFVFLSFEKLTGFDKWKIPNIIRHIYTLLIVLFGWVLFRAADITDALAFFKVMFGMADAPFWNDTATVFSLEALFFLICGAVFSTPVMDKLKQFTEGRNILAALGSVLKPVVYIGIFLLCISFLLKNAYNPFIYFNF
ncbi:MAG: MBOAT family protein [Firmicutes bacterium]|nr:MBOAT family protein [Bacillota bacterium]